MSETTNVESSKKQAKRKRAKAVYRISKTTKSRAGRFVEMTIETPDSKHTYEVAVGPIKL